MSARVHRASQWAVAALVAGILLSSAASAPAQAPREGTIKDLFAAYVYYEDDPGTRNGVPTPLALSAAELEYVRLSMRDGARGGFALLARTDGAHWMGLERSGSRQLLRIRDLSNEYNGRLAVDMVSGRLTVLRGVDYAPFNVTEDAAIAASLAIGYLRRAMSGLEVFPAALRLPAVDLGSLAAGAAGAPQVSPAGPPRPAMPDAPSSGREASGFLRLWSTAGVAARELFAADKFGNDSVIESGDFAQASLLYTDAEGRHELTGRDLEARVLGRARAPENPLRVEELESMLSALSSKAGGLDVTVLPMRTTFHVPSRPPAIPPEGVSPGGRGAALEIFEYLQALSLLAGEYTVVPEAALAAPGLTKEDLDLYWWARIQRASTPGAFYPALIDSGGSLAWGDFALFATIRLQRAKIPSMIVIIRRPDGARPPYRAACLYQVGPGWRWMDAGKLGEESVEDWQRLPARIEGADVVFRIVDVARDWLSYGVDESSGWLFSRLGP